MWQGKQLSDSWLQEHFGITTGFHPGQREIIEQLLQGCRVLAIQRTGWGKSLCYQATSLSLPDLTLVFSPLKALMRDQCQKCNISYHIPAAIVSSDFSERENRETLECAAAGKIKLLYIAPERLSNTLWQSYIPRLRISMVVIDEAHCISTWGHDFRPHYRRIVRLLDALPHNTPVLALTATANERVEQDILQQMGGDVQVIRGPMQRPNLQLYVVQVHGHRDKLSYLGETLGRSPGAGIVYTATQKDAEMVAAFLQQQSIAAEYYHAGREDSVRQEIEQRFMTNCYKVICSTNALGMGIDKRNIRFIIHYNIPASPIHYYQEIGRAGRDGKRAWCILLYDPVDIRLQERLIEQAKPASTRYETVLSLLKSSASGLSEYAIMRTTGFSQHTTRTILAHLEDQRLVEWEPESRTYCATTRLKGFIAADYDILRQQKLQELGDMQHYAQHKECYMAYLTSYLGDGPGYRCDTCGHCQPTNFPVIDYSSRVQNSVVQFLEEGYLPRIEKRGTAQAPIHKGGWALAYQCNSNLGKLVQASKYEKAGPFALSIVMRATRVIRTRYPLPRINAIVSVPPTRSGILVESFARQVAAILNIPYLPVITKKRETQEQRYLKNRWQKEDNVKDAFMIQSPQLVADRTLLLIDDTYDSGLMLREVSRTLIQAGARAVYPLTITRTMHSDDQEGDAVPDDEHNHA